MRNIVEHGKDQSSEVLRIIYQRTNIDNNFRNNENLSPNIYPVFYRTEIHRYGCSTFMRYVFDNIRKIVVKLNLQDFVLVELFHF